MTRVKESSLPAVKRERVSWPLYGLQSLPAGKFVDIVGRILSGHCAVVAPKTKRNPN